MKAQIIQIGNSQGIRIPKAVLEETKLSGEVEMEVTAEGLLIRNIKRPRGDWDSVFRSLAEADDDMILNEAATGFTKKDWQW